jgi:hypothetical protein
VERAKADNGRRVQSSSSLKRPVSPHGLWGSPGLEVLHGTQGRGKAGSLQFAGLAVTLPERTCRALLVLLLLALSLEGCRGNCQRTSTSDRTTATTEDNDQQPLVWAMDDGQWLRRSDPLPTLANGIDNPLWGPGRAIHLLGLPGETVAFQVIVSSNANSLSEVRIELPELNGPKLLSASTGSGSFREIESFVVHELPMRRRSGGRTAGESLGWEVGSEPPMTGRGTSLPDPLIPVSLAPQWAPYPLSIPARSHGVVWFDVTIPDSLPPGDYRGTVAVTARLEGGPIIGLGSLPIELETLTTTLPYAATPTMVYAETDKLIHRIGSGAALLHHLQLLHRHHLTPFLPLRSMSELDGMLDSLTGSLFTQASGYSGPGEGIGSSVIVIGAYGCIGPPTPQARQLVASLLSRLAELGLRDLPGRRDLFLYAVDEQCDSPLAGQWREAIRQTLALKGLRVGQTCARSPALQDADLVMLPAQGYSQSMATVERRPDQRVWIYNGMLPKTGTFLSDAPFLGLRANPLIAAAAGIERWFYWESAFWHDTNPGGLGPYDPFSTAETFHNQHGDHANGDGVLVYPGTQLQFPAHSLGFPGVLPSLRLKQWRRGIQDVGYWKLAAAAAPERAAAILQELVGTPLRSGRPARPVWSRSAADFARARRAFFLLLKEQQDKPR